MEEKLKKFVEFQLQCAQHAISSNQVWDFEGIAYGAVQFYNMCVDLKKFNKFEPWWDEKRKEFLEIWKEKER